MSSAALVEQIIPSKHIPSKAWDFTPNGEKRGFIQPHSLDELWFHTGTRCNLACDFCLEGSSPSDKRLESPKLAEVIPLIDEGLKLNVKQFSFTGGEPLLVKDIVDILAYASQFKPCLVLTNGTDPLLKRFASLVNLQAKKQYPIAFRISLDSPDEVEHDEGRGQGSFAKAMIGLRKLYVQGFNVSIARHMGKNENTPEVEQQYRALLSLNGLPRDLTMVAFPDFMPPGSLPNVPHITASCMTQYKTEESRKSYMCANSKMIIKKNGEMQVYACTLVDDDDDYFLATTLTESMSKRISMKHHRCYSCFAFGASCSEM